MAGLVVPTVSKSNTETCALHSLNEAISITTYLRLGQQRKREEEGWCNREGGKRNSAIIIFEKETSFCHKQHHCIETHCVKALTSGLANSQFTDARQRERKRTREP